MRFLRPLFCPAGQRSAVARAFSLSDDRIFRHISNRSAYAVLEHPNSKYRRLPRLPGILQRLTAYDYVLEHSSLRWYALTRAKLDLMKRLGVSRPDLPQRTYQSRYDETPATPDTQSVQYFVDHSPIGISPGWRVVFVFVAEPSRPRNLYRHIVGNYGSLFRVLRARGLRVSVVPLTTPGIVFPVSERSRLAALASPPTSLDRRRLFLHVEAQLLRRALRDKDLSIISTYPGKFVACSDSGTDTRAPVWYKCSVNNHLRHHGGPCVTTDTVPQTVLFPDLFDKPLFARFNQEQASSDGGAILLKAAERIYGLVKAFAGCLFDKRAPDKTRHSLADLIGQRIFGIACGHPDCNDGDRLADDPIHKLLLDRDPVSGERLASQPTLSRFENAVNGCALYRMADELATRVIARHRRRLDGRARCITIDLDPTDDPTHGAQQYTLFNGYYDNWCYLPLLGFLTFDRESEQYLCAALLRHGKAVASEGTVGLLSRLLPRLRRAFPRARILVRLDGGFASPAVFAFLEAQPRLDYVVAMAKNAVLERHAGPAMLVARARTWRSEQTEHVYTETDEYQAGTWNHARRVVIKAEVVRLADREPRDNPRFVVTNMRQTPRFLYEKVYCARGDAENRIKELKALQIDRTSCQAFSANQLRVLLTAAAYVLMQELRLRAADTACARTQMPWLRDRLLKLGVQVVRSARRIVLRLPRATPDLAAWRHIAFALGARAG